MNIYQIRWSVEVFFAIANNTSNWENANQPGIIILNPLIAQTPRNSGSSFCFLRF